MDKYLKIFSAVLLLGMGNFTAYSSNLMDKDELDQTPCSTLMSMDDSILASKAVAARSTNSVNTLRNYLLGGAFVLASQVQTALAKEPGFGWDEEMSNTNSTGSAPSTTGPNVGVFYVNNIALTVTAATLSVVILPRINDYIIIPGLKYLWNRFYKTTIDDVPVGPELDNLNFRQRWWGKLYEKASQNLYREKLRDQTSVKFKTIKLIDESLGDHPLWERKEIYSGEKLVGFSYKSSVCEFKIQNPLRTADIEMIEVKDAERLKSWQDFAKTFIGEGDEDGIKIIPKKIFRAISLLCLDNSEDQDFIRMEKKSEEAILFGFDPKLELYINLSST